MHFRTLSSLTAILLSCATFSSSDVHALGLRDEYTIDSSPGSAPAPARVPEGVAFDPLLGDFYASALFGGRITAINALSGSERTFYQETNPVISFAGIKVAPLQRVVWTCALDGSNPALPTSQVYAIRMRAQGPGEVVRRVALPGPFFFCNDLALDLEGNVYVTNSYGSAIMKIPVRALRDSSVGAQVLVDSPLLAPTIGPDGAPIIGMNGIAVTPNNAYLLVGRTTPARLLRVSLAQPSDVRPVEFMGDAFAQDPDPEGDDTLFVNPDGIVFSQGRLYVTYVAGMQRLTFTNNSFLKARVATTTDVPPGLTTCTSAYGNVYAIDSDIQALLPGSSLPLELPHTIVRMDDSLF
jgi:sugar lactone lactonase YvrE